MITFVFQVMQLSEVPFHLKFTNNYKIVNVTVIYAFKLFRVYLDS